MSSIDKFFQDNSKWLLVALFSAGIIYSEFQAFKTVEERLGKKIKVIQENKETIHKLEIRIVKLEIEKCN